jgi:hypothetical protein
MRRRIVEMVGPYAAPGGRNFEANRKLVLVIRTVRRRVDHGHLPDPNGNRTTDDAVSNDTQRSRVHGAHHSRVLRLSALRSSV